jgi:hypothetical protein
MWAGAAQSTFINTIIGGTPTIIQTLEYTLLNSVIAYVGYFFAAFTIDRKWMGRTRMQVRRGKNALDCFCGCLV